VSVPNSHPQRAALFAGIDDRFADVESTPPTCRRSVLKSGLVEVGIVIDCMYWVVQQCETREVAILTKHLNHKGKWVNAVMHAGRGLEAKRVTFALMS